MSQSSVLEPVDFVFRRKCKRTTTEIHASAMKMALVAIIARDAEVVMLKRGEVTLQSRGGKGLIKASVQKIGMMGLSSREEIRPVATSQTGLFAASLKSIYLSSTIMSRGLNYVMQPVNAPSGH